MSRIKKRGESFFGIHSDFHARPSDGLVIGETLKECDIREICERLMPDFVQIDCKGHPGWVSYPSALGNAMPEIKEAPISLWRKITKEYGIALFVHFSGVYDVKYCKEHPEDAVIDAEGKATTSVLPFSKYYDDFFIPQICEVVENYDIDGIWFDGECWAVRADYRPETVLEFERDTGISLGGNPPKSSVDPYYSEYLEYARDKFRKVLSYYTDALHKKFPGLQICSNWAFSDHMPEKVCADVDFLSGDLDPANCVNSARYAGRMLAQQNMSWDLMSWYMRWQVYDNYLIPPKNHIQLMQEAAAVISLGGAYQMVISQFNDGSHNLKQFRKIVPLADFMHQREKFCFKGKQIHQTAVLVSTPDRYSEMTTPFSREGIDKFIGLASLLSDSGQSYELAGEHTLEGHYSDYPMIIVPELYSGISKDTVEKLRKYVSDGGNLMLVGSKTSKFFADKDFGFESETFDEISEIPNWIYEDDRLDVAKSFEKNPCYFSLNGEEHGVTFGACKINTKAADAKVFGTLHNSLRSDGVPFAVEYACGKGKIAVVGIDLGSQYHNGMQYQHRELIKNISEELYSPLARVESVCGLLEIVCLEKDGHLMLQLVNGNGAHANPRSVTEDSLAPVVDVKLSVKADFMPKKVLLQPGNIPVEFEYINNRIYFKIDRIDIHNVVEVI